MTKEQKELLLKDLCARLPYGVKCAYFDMGGNEQDGTLMAVMPHEERLLVDKCSMDYSGCDVLGVVPYLFPLSSMTEVQKEEYEDSLTYHDYTEGGWVIAKSFNDEYIVPYWLVDFCNKNHLDYRGLIEKGLAIDATGLNIYMEEPK